MTPSDNNQETTEKVNKGMRRNYVLSCVLALVYMFVAPSLSAHNNGIERFAEVVDSLHRHIVFPYNMAPGIVLTNVGVDKGEGMLVVNYLLNPEYVDVVSNNVASENGIAQLLTGYDEIFSISMIEAEAGFRTIITYPDADGLNKTKIVTVPASSIPIVYNKLKNGDYSSLKPYLEMLQSTFSSMQFPVKIANGIYLINAIIKDKEVDWIYKVDGDIKASDISDTIIQNNRNSLINTLRSNMSPDYLIEIEEKGISLRYSYFNERGDLLYELILTAEDLK